MKIKQTCNALAKMARVNLSGAQDYVTSAMG